MIKVGSKLFCPYLRPSAPCISLAVDPALGLLYLPMQSPLLGFCSYKAAFLLLGFALEPAGLLKTNGGRNPLWHYQILQLAENTFDIRPYCFVSCS